jgi:hypothetical protein
MKLKMMKLLLDNLTTEQLNALSEIKFAKRRIVIRTTITPTVTKILAEWDVKLLGSPLGILTGKTFKDEIEISWIIEA